MVKTILAAVSVLAVLSFALVPSVRAAEFSFAYGPDVSDKVQKHVETAMSEADAFFRKKLGTTLTNQTAIFVSADPSWLTDAYLMQNGLDDSYRPGKMEYFSGCHGGEAVYGAIFMCSKSDVFSKDWFGSGSAAQRTFALTHEYFHNLQFELGGDRARRCCKDGDDSLSLLGPQWLVEGSAEYMAFVILGDTGRMNFKKQVADQLRKAGTVGTSLSGLETRSGYYSERGASWAGLSAVHMLVDKSGFESLRAFWSAMGADASWQDAFQTTFGETPDDFYTAYDKAVR